MVSPEIYSRIPPEIFNWIPQGAPSEIFRYFYRTPSVPLEMAPVVSYENPKEVPSRIPPAVLFEIPPNMFFSISPGLLSNTYPQNSEIAFYFLSFLSVYCTCSLWNASRIPSSISLYVTSGIP